MSFDVQASALRHDALLADRRGRLRAAERGRGRAAAAGWSGGRAMRATADRRLWVLGRLRRPTGATVTTAADGGA